MLFRSTKKKIFSFTKNNDDYSIEECIKGCKSKWDNSWRLLIESYSKDDVKVWWHSLDYRKTEALSYEDFEQVFLISGLMPRTNIKWDIRVYFLY